ncbi:MAG TPA: GFA family protein [Hyphomicrobiaceae bacterium]
MPESQTHQGACHCGAVRYTAETDLGQVIQCNCSICSKHGLLISFVPEDNFTLLSGEGNLKEYLFNTHKVRHQFCQTCGTEPFARGTAPDGKKMVALNVRCLDDVDIASLKTTPFDGRSR